MTDLQNMIEPAGIIPALKAHSKKQALQDLATKGAELTGIAEREIFETILRREKLGSTGVGQGIAIPHGKLEGLDRIVGVFARLTRPIDFDALDDQPVDLVFLMLAPEASGPDHLKALSKVARLLRNPETVAAIRSSQDAGAIYSLMTAGLASDAA